MGLDPIVFQFASLRQVLQVSRSFSQKMREDWHKAILIYTKIHNVNVSKRGDMIDPEKLMRDMFGISNQTDNDVNLLDKFRLFVLETKGTDYRA